MRDKNQFSQQPLFPEFQCRNGLISIQSLDWVLRRDTNRARNCPLLCYSWFELVQSGSGWRELDRTGYTAKMRFSVDLLFVSAAKIWAAFLKV